MNETSFNFNLNIKDFVLQVEKIENNLSIKSRSKTFLTRRRETHHLTFRINTLNLSNNLTIHN